ncbi:hypothetical protein [Breoghania sp.]|uniref:hypothetical protein n=1 Tax=Breoghania sp. TaxID=2065378 RepID=UPI002AA7D69D|nr:hypothetical protein [Breoghania sp.]
MTFFPKSEAGNAVTRDYDVKYLFAPTFWKGRGYFPSCGYPAPLEGAEASELSACKTAGKQISGSDMLSQ